MHLAPALGHYWIADIRPAHIRDLYRRLEESGLSPNTVRRIATTLSRALLALTWANLRLDDSADASVQVMATQQYVKGKGLLSEATKTTHSRSVLPIPPTVVEILRRHRTRQIEERLAATAWTDQNLVFCTGHGTPISLSNNMRSWHSLRDRAGVRRMRVHDLRHAFVTHLLTLGESPKVVQELARHGSIHVTMDTYAHVMPAAKRDAAAKMDKLMRGETSIG